MLHLFWTAALVIAVLGMIIGIAILGAYAITAGFQLVDDGESSR